MGNVNNIQEDLDKLRDRLTESREDIAASIVTEHAPDKEKAKQYNLQLLDLMITSLHEDEELILEQIRQIATTVGEWTQGEDYTLDVAISEMNQIRTMLWQKYKEIMTDLNVQINTVYYVSELYHPPFNEFLHSFSLSYIQSYERYLEKSEREFLSLSAPVVPILEGVAVLPVVGSINEQRAELLMQNALAEASTNELDRMFIDLSGVTLIDTMVAYHLFNIVRALEIIGVSVFLIGIRPETAQTMVSLGVDFSKVRTYHSLQQALKRQGVLGKCE